MRNVTLAELWWLFFLAVQISKFTPSLGTKMTTATEWLTFGYLLLSISCVWHEWTSHLMQGKRISHIRCPHCCSWPPWKIMTMFCVCLFPHCCGSPSQNFECRLHIYMHILKILLIPYLSFHHSIYRLLFFLVYIVTSVSLDWIKIPNCIVFLVLVWLFKLKK